MKRYTPRIYSLRSQSGMVSLVVTLIMMIVITITVLGFSQVARREQRQALDKQLSSQAYYAAESGVNAASSIINTKYLANNLSPPDKTSCTTDINPGDYDLFNGNNVINSSTNTSYTCVLIDPSPPEIKYDISSSGTSKVIPIKTSGTTIDTLNISWTRDDAYADTAANPLTNCQDSSKSQPAVKANGPATAAWDCKFGIVRMDLIPMGSLNRTDMLANTFTGFFSPDTTGTATVEYAPGGNINSTNTTTPGSFCGQDPNAPECRYCSNNWLNIHCLVCRPPSAGPIIIGPIFGIDCANFCSQHPHDPVACEALVLPTAVNGSAANQGARPAAICDETTCRISITGLTANSYFARISSIYRDTSVTISATGGGITRELLGVQAKIDSTGRARDVLRRIQVRIPLVNNTDRLHNDYAIESTEGICKTYFSYPGYAYTRNNDWNWCG